MQVVVGLANPAKMVGEAGSRTGAFSSQARRSTLIPFPDEIEIHYALRNQNQLNLWRTYLARW